MLTIKMLVEIRLGIKLKITEDITIVKPAAAKLAPKSPLPVDLLVAKKVDKNTTVNNPNITRAIKIGTTEPAY